jgi:signal transduction histidine kinase
VHPRSLTGRIAAAFLVLGLTVLLAVGGATFVVLRGLHADATEAGLADLADSLLPQIRQGLAAGDVRGSLGEVRLRLADRGIEVILVTADGTLRTLDGTALEGSVALDADAARGDIVHGQTTIDDERRLYAATLLQPRAVGPKAVVFSVPDRSGAQALADLGRAIPVVLVVLLVVGGPLAWLLSRSVGAPLRRLAAATADLPAGGHATLPLEGPTEVRELTARFNAMADELETTRARESELLANLRHDLRTPLTVISGFAAALSDGTASGPDATRAAAAIAEEADRLERLVAELGAIERLRAGTEGLRPEPIDPPALLASTLERFVPQAASTGVALDVAPIEGALPAVTADRLAIERILANLVDNALRAAPAGGHVWLEARAVAIGDGAAASDGIALSVTDDGPGFPPGAAGRAFERFFRADPARSGPGSGLGLAIVRELAEAHGGSAYAENLVPRGARVGVVLPAVPAGSIG